MFCPNCGHQIPDDAVFCPDCGQSTQPAASQQPGPEPAQPEAAPSAAQANPGQPETSQPQQPPVYNAEPMQSQSYQYQYSMQYAPDTRRMNGLCVAGFVVGLVSIFFYIMGIMGVVALVLSGLGLSSSARNNQRGRGLAIAGLVLGIVSTVLGVVFICTCASSCFLAAL